MSIRPLLFALSTAALMAAAFADETEVLFHGADAQGWSTMRDAARTQREFTVNELRTEEESGGLRWRFVSKGVAFNDVFLLRPIARPFRTLRVVVANRGEPFSLAFKMRDASGGEWTIPPIALPAGPQRTIELNRDQWRVASWSRDPDGELDFPVDFLAVIAFGLKPGRRYDILLHRIEVIRPDPPVAAIRRFTLPDRLRAGASCPLGLTFILDRRCRQTGAAVTFRRQHDEARTTFDLPLPLPQPTTQLPAGRPVTVDTTLTIPQFAYGGRYSVSLRLGDAHLQRGRARVDQEVATVTIEQRKPGRITARVQRHNGVPALFINGRSHRGTCWATYHPTRRVFGDFSQAGIDLFTFAGTPTEAGYNLSKTVWVSPDEYDYSQFDARVMMLLETNPNARFFPRLYLHAPKWWSEQHPDDIVLMDPGDGRPVPFIHSGGKPAPSWASETWRRDTMEGLRRLIAHIDASPYADHVIGYHLSSGTTEEWMMWGANENQWVDYSPVNTARFRQWLRRRYGDDKGLQSAWRDPRVSLATASIPTKAQRQEAHFGALRDPASERPAIDYYLYNADLVADTINYFARGVKELTRGEKIVGVFYGYLLQLCGEQRQQNAGHLALAKVLASPDVDFLCSPTSYAFRQVGGAGTSHFMSLLGSIQLHGKLWFDENDIRTSLAPGKPGQWGRPTDIDGDLLQQDKELTNCIVNGAAQWWFDVGANRYDDSRLMARIADWNRCAGEAVNLNRAPVDEVALVVDERSLTYLRVGDPLGRWLLLSQLPALHRIGAPAGHYLVEDLPRLTDRKLLLFTTSLAPTAADRRNIDRLKSDGRVLVFVWAQGLYRDGAIDEAAMSDLTGIRLRLSRDAAPLRVTVADGHELTSGLEGQRYGADRPSWPVVFPDDPQAEVLGCLDDGRPGLVIKRLDDWTAVFSAAPLLPSKLLRSLARSAGIHEYVDTEDVVWATRHLLGVSVNEAGPRTIHLSRKASVRDLFTGATLATAADSFTTDFPDKGTRAFVIR